MRFRFADYVLDVARRELWRGSEPVALEPQVFDLLAHLIRNRDRVVSKDDLLESVWGGRIVSESTLTSRINAARKAVGDSGEAQRLIRTVPRRAFRLVGENRHLNESERAIVVAWLANMRGHSTARRLRRWSREILRVLCQRHPGLTLIAEDVTRRFYKRCVIKRA